MDTLILTQLLKLTTHTVSGHSQVLQAIRNKIQHMYNGNPRLLLLDPLIDQPQRITLSLDSLIPECAPPGSTISIQTILGMRPHPIQGASLIPLQPNRLLRNKNRKGRRIQRRHHTTGYRVFAKSTQSFPTFNKPSQTTPQGNSQGLFYKNSRIRSYKAIRPAPPPSGAPGVGTPTNEECKPSPLIHTPLSGQGSRVLRRRLYRQWRRTCRGNIGQLCLGKMIVNKGMPRRAAKQHRQGNTNARLFKHLVLSQGLHKGPQREKTHKPMATPQLGYGYCLKVGTQNVQGMAEILKHQQILDIMQEKSLQLMFLTETRSTSYYTYNSLGYLWILNGNIKDRFAGITAVVAPHIRPFVKDVIQHTSRILQITLSMQSGDVHFIGVYAPHDKHDYSSVKEPFWETLTDIVSSIPYPEPFYITGDFNVRLQGRKRGEEQHIGPHVFGKGPLAAKTGPERNRTLYTNFLQSVEGCDCQTFKTPNMTKQVTYRDKTPPPMSWIQFSADPVPLLQLWDIVHGLPLNEQESLSVAQTIRSFLTNDSLIDAGQVLPKNDPYRFQALDKVVCRRSWLPSVKQCYAVHTTGFPSDHYLLVSHIQVKLGAKPQLPPRTVRYDYTSDAAKTLHFNQVFRCSLVGSSYKEQATPQGLLEIYTDGSGSKGRATRATPAGWGFVVTVRDVDIVHSYGPVNVDETSPFYLGAAVSSNNSGELSAIIEALLYLLHPTVHNSRVIFYYDSKWAANMARGTSRPKRHKRMVDTARLLLHELEQKMQVDWEWIKGHTGNKGNEKADALAEKGKGSSESYGGRYDQEPPRLIRNLSPPTAELESTTLEEKCRRFNQAIQTAEAITFHPVQHTPRRPWISATTMRQLREVKQLKAAEDPEYVQRYRRLKTQARKEKRDWLGSQIGDNYTLSKQLWAHARKLKKGFQERKRRLVVNGRQVPWSQTHKAFAEHLSQTQWGPSMVTLDELNLLSQTTPLHQPDTVDPGYFTMVELQDAISKIRKNRAPGPDNIRGDLIKLLNYYGEIQLLDIFNQCWKEKRIPQGWKDAIAVSFYKGKGDDSDAASYRPISLLNTQYKLYAAMIQNRLSDSYDYRIRSTQFGFRKNKSTSDPLFILRRLQDYSSRTGTPFHCLFVDWKQAFDKIDHAAMLTALQRLGLHQHYIEVIRDIYTEPTFYTIGINGDKFSATPHTGIRQGCPLSPYLFIMVLTVILADVDTRLLAHGVPTNTWSVGKPVYDLEYADDTMLFGISVEVLEEYLQTLQVEASLYGLFLNFTKTELLRHPKLLEGQVRFTQGDPVPIADTVKYLGSQVAWEKPTLSAILHRISVATTAFNKLQHIWRSSLSRKIRVHIFLANIVSSLLHGLPPLTFEDKHYHKVDSWFFRHLRRVIGIKSSYYSHVTNKSVWYQAGRPPLPSQLILSQQFRLLLNSLQAPPTEPLHHVAFGPALKDRISLHKHYKTGPPPPYWVHLVGQKALEFYQATIGEDPDKRRDLLGLRQYCNRNLDFPALLLAAPTRKPQTFKIFQKTIGSAWLP